MREIKNQNYILLSDLYFLHHEYTFRYHSHMYLLVKIDVYQNRPLFRKGAFLQYF